MPSQVRALIFSIAVNFVMASVLLSMVFMAGTPLGAPAMRGIGNRSGVQMVNVRHNQIHRGVAASAGRKFFVGGNWKCNGNRNSIKQLIDGLNSGAPLNGDVEVVCAPPAPYIDYTRQNLRKDFAVSGQNTWVGTEGAYTGEIAAEMLKDIGCEWVILGHSERRHLPEIKETDAVIAQKAKYSLDQGLGVIYCIGELLEEREAGRTLEVCESQMAAAAAKITDWSKVVIAYEPVWAIGTGKVATPEQAQQVHDSVRAWLARNVSPEVATRTRILYGGSVNPSNCDELAGKPDIDGFLVGGASLKPDFLKIVDSYKHAVPATP
mmetsp:Transcript_15271/g.21462  ORF Transcript_15271/g.21462 Transcript_15271/m.21462 type:complete len:322 (-) Transcript_15271:405-1370(-)|eukprot:CAMPEP_0184487398 /NCGR_PEP_ID=MMETSP0113_2-20130426/10000_1 /TAXON_ID=91329 /ORGANISM="Norrisiella sphaerica, Strain BC52" /LENGTH=321 /DNA_ID=CAMNT_0026869701 /DNA_START=46 /DNA_END=1011 /DNA_ORIENTATION=-